MTCATRDVMATAVDETSNFSVTAATPGEARPTRQKKIASCFPTGMDRVMLRAARKTCEVILSRIKLNRSLSSTRGSAGAHTSR
jgi:hypothetical protein